MFVPLLVYQTPKNVEINTWLLNYYLQGHQSAQMVCTTLWKIWQGRNRVLFQVKGFNLIEISNNVANLVKNYNYAQATKHIKEKANIIVNVTNVAEAEVIIYVDVGCFQNGFTT